MTPPTITGDIEYIATVVVHGTVTASNTSLDKYEGLDVGQKIDAAIRNHLIGKYPGVFSAYNIKFKPKSQKDSHFLAQYSVQLAEKMEKEEENKKSYIGELICTDKKKLVSFNYPMLKESWRQQRDIWGTWKEFIRIFLDDQTDCEESEKEGSDIPGTYIVTDESDLRKKLLRDFTDDSEKLGFIKKQEKEQPQT